MMEPVEQVEMTQAVDEILIIQTVAVDPKMVLVSKIDIRMSSLHIQTDLIPEMEILTTYSLTTRVFV